MTDHGAGVVEGPARDEDHGHDHMNEERQRDVAAGLLGQVVVDLGGGRPRSKETVPGRARSASGETRVERYSTDRNEWCSGDRETAFTKVLQC